MIGTAFRLGRYKERVELLKSSVQSTQDLKLKSGNPTPPLESLSLLFVTIE